MIESDNGLLRDRDRIVSYLVAHNGVVFSPDGRLQGVTPEQIEAHNEALDKLLIAQLDASRIGDRGTLYVRDGICVLNNAGIKTYQYRVQTWLGETVALAVSSNTSITFRRTLADGTRGVFRGRLRKDGNAFNYRRVK